MTEMRDTDKVYTEGLKKILSDEKTREELETDPEGTLKKLGFQLDDNARAELAKGASQTELGVAAVPAVLVRVATQGTRPAVSVVVRTSVGVDTRDPDGELNEE